jgi:hypothetical protein
MSSGWKTVYRDGPHYFEDGRSLCGLFTERRKFQSEDEPRRQDTCTKCW